MAKFQVPTKSGAERIFWIFWLVWLKPCSSILPYDVRTFIFTLPTFQNKVCDNRFCWLKTEILYLCQNDIVYYKAFYFLLYIFCFVLNPSSWKLLSSMCMYMYLKANFVLILVLSNWVFLQKTWKNFREKVAFLIHTFTSPLNSVQSNSPKFCWTKRLIISLINLWCLKYLKVPQD